MKSTASCQERKISSNVVEEVCDDHSGNPLCDARRALETRKLDACIRRRLGLLGILSCRDHGIKDSVFEQVPSVIGDYRENAITLIHDRCFSSTRFFDLYLSISLSPSSIRFAICTRQDRFKRKRRKKKKKKK